MTPKIGSYHLSPYGFSQWTISPRKHQEKPMASDLEAVDRFAQVKSIGLAMQNWLLSFKQKDSQLPEMPKTKTITYLDNATPRKHLLNLSQIKPDSALQSIATEQIAKLLPRENAIRLGYDDRTQYESVLGDTAIAGIATLTALGILGTTFAKTFACMVHEEDKIEYVYAICKSKTATFWSGPSGKTTLVASALFLGAMSYLHKKGWLGAWIRDPFVNRRSRQITALFQTSAQELAKIKTTHPKAAEKLAEQILINLGLIENTLFTELQLPAHTVQETVKTLRVACKAALLKKPVLAKKEPSS